MAARAQYQKPSPEVDLQKGVETPPPKDSTAGATDKILVSLVFLMFGLAGFGLIALSANFRAAATLCLAAVPFVLVATLLWFRKASR